MKTKLWNKFIKYGSGFTLEAERDYKAKGEPLIYHLFLYGLWADDKNEFIGQNINQLMQDAIRMFQNNMARHSQKVRLKY